MDMKRLRSSLAAGLAALCIATSGIGKGELEDIAKPHLGVYECTEARMGDKDYLERFSYIHLELKADDRFVLYYCEKEGKKQVQKGWYNYDKGKGIVTLQGGGLKREFPLAEGIITAVIPIGGYTVQLKFEQK